MLSQSESLDPCAHVFRVRAGRHHTGQIALYVSHKDRNPHITERLSHNSECHSLSGSCGAGDQTVSVCLAGQKADLLARVVKC